MEDKGSLPRIRKLVSKKYVDIRYRLEPTPITLRNSVQGHNLIKHSDSSGRFDSKKGVSKSGRLDTQKSQNEINPVLLQLNVQDQGIKSSGRCYTVMKNKLIEKKYFSNLKRKIINSEQDRKMLVNNLYLNYDLAAQRPESLAKLRLRRTPSIKTILSSRRSVPKSFDSRDAFHFSPMREVKFN